MYDDMHAVITNECAEKGSLASPPSSSTLLLVPITTATLKFWTLTDAISKVS